MNNLILFRRCICCPGLDFCKGVGRKFSRGKGANGKEDRKIAKNTEK